MMTPEIVFAQAALDSVFNRYDVQTVAADSAPPPTDKGELTQGRGDLIAKIERSAQGEKYKKLSQGHWQGEYPSQSEAELALCLILAWWCKKDSEQMDAIFRQSGLYRDKWDEKHGQFTYGAITIGKAIAKTDTVYGDGTVKKVISAPMFRLIQAGMITPKPPQWLIYDLFEVDSLCLLFGDPGCGKSFVAIDIALSVATGAPFNCNNIEQGSVVYIAGEGHNGLMRRMAAWGMSHNISYKDAPLFISETPAALTDAHILSQVQAAIDEVTATHGPPVLIVIDTLARNFGPGDENSTQDMSQFIQAVDALRATCKATVLIVHHSGHGDKSRARGAMALKGALDAEYRLDKEEATGVIRMVATKMKDAEHPKPIAFQLRQVPLSICNDDGSPIFSAVLESVDYAPSPQKGKAGQGKHQVKALEILKRLHSEKRKRATEEGKSPETARVFIDEWKSAMKQEGIPQQRLFDVINSLKTAKSITEVNGYCTPL